MNLVLIGNLVMFVGSGIMVLTGLLKKKQSILAAQTVQCAIQAVGNYLLGGISGSIAGVVSMIRNLVCIKWGFTLPLKLLFIAAQSALTLAFNRNGLLGLMPLLATSVYIWVMDTTDEKKLKAAIIFTQVCWGLFDIQIHNYVGIVFDCSTILSNALGIYLLLKEARRNR